MEKEYDILDTIIGWKDEIIKDLKLTLAEKDNDIEILYNAIKNIKKIAELQVKIGNFFRFEDILDIIKKAEVEEE